MKNALDHMDLFDKKTKRVVLVAHNFSVAYKKDCVTLHLSDFQTIAFALDCREFTIGHAKISALVS